MTENAEGRNQKAEPQGPPSARLLLWSASALCAAGILLRIVRWAQSRDLWLDEVFLANNLIHKSPLALLGQLDYRQGAPPLFLLLAKLSITLFGDGERALRLVSLLAGIASLPLFYAVARRFLPPIAALAALALFATLEPLIYYASEVKQYSSDVAVTLAVLLLFLRQAESPGNPRRLLALAFGVPLALFSSHPALFVIAAGAIPLLVNSILKGPANGAAGKPRILLPILALWSLAFLSNWYFFLRPLAKNEGLQHHWSYAYPPHSIAALPAWFYDTYLEVFRGYSTMWLWFDNALGVWPAYVAAGLSVIGWIVLALTRRRPAILIALPILLTLAASSLHKYPFDGRLILFLVPCFLIPVAAPICRKLTLPALLAFAFILLSCASRALTYALHPPGREEITPVMRYLNAHYQPGDALYLYHAADAPYLFYHDRLALPDIPFTHGRRDTESPGAFARDADQLAGRPRVWILFSHIWDTPDGDEEQQLLDQFRQRGIELDSARSTGASLYLFRM